MRLMKELSKSYPKEARLVLEAFMEEPCCGEDRGAGGKGAMAGMHKRK